jgi:hypothetical protein
MSDVFENEDENLFREYQTLEDEIVIDVGYGCVDFVFNGYRVPLNEIENEKGLLRWIRHLIRKPWMTRDRLEFFIDLVAKHKGITL